MLQEYADFPLADADKCVKCALCLPHCPTYRETLDEGESPRGRIALMQAFASGALEITPTLAGHLDRCLACRACEAVCPAEVPYGKLIDAARAELVRHGYQEPGTARCFAACMRHTRLLRGVHVLLWLAQLLRLQKFAGLIPRLRRLVKMLPSITAPRRWQRVNLPSHGGRQEVELFLGCIARITQPEVTRASVKLLNTLGYSVRIPAGQVCCGALDQHAGRTAAAAAQAGKNLEAFSKDTSVPLLHTASGCGATLGEYPLLVADARAPAFSRRCRDISDFLRHQQQFEHIKFRPLRATVLVHSPCTLKNVLRAHRSVPALLQHIPQLQVVMLPDTTACCGAAGSYVLSEPQMADHLADNIIMVVKRTCPAILVTSNVGCSLHLRTALQRHGLDIPVLHPAELLATQLPDEAGTGAIIRA